jgi:uncharacterized protein
MDLRTLAVLVPVSMIGGFLRGFAGFGGPLFMLPILNAFFPPASSIGIMMWVDIFANVHLLPHARRHSSSRVVVPLTIGTLIGMPLGASVLLAADPAVMKRTIAAAILAAALILLSGWRYPGRIGKPTLAGVGVLSGSVMGASAIAVVTPLFLSASSDTAAQNRANFIVWVFFATVLLLAILMWNGKLDSGDLGTIAVLTPAYLLGTVLGSHMQGRAKDLTVRRTVLVLVIAVAAVSLVRG